MTNLSTLNSNASLQPPPTVTDGSSSAAPGTPNPVLKKHKWSELSITKSPRITFIAIGHEGQHALLLSDEGVSYFVGVARKGEDGEMSKNLDKRYQSISLNLYFS